MQELQTKLLISLRGKILKHTIKADEHLALRVTKEHLPTVCRYLTTLGGRLLTMAGTDERGLNGQFGLYYVFAFDHEHGFVTLRADVEEADPVYPSVTPELAACDWYEREVHDLLGLQPLGHPNPAPLVVHGDWPEGHYPLRKDYPAPQKQPRVAEQDVFTTYEGEGVTQVPVGPIHAGIIEPGHFRFGVAGDTILHLDAQLFYKHRGLEKVSEGMPLEQALFLAERICGVCALSHAIAFAQAAEQIAQTDIPPRARYLRTLFLELERLYNHIGDVGNICAGAGFHFGTSHGARLKEELQQLNEQVAGHRYLRGVAALGGVRRDVGEDELNRLRRALPRIEQEFRELTETILNHEIVLDRMATTGRLSLELADRLEVVGPAARAAGRTVDIRKSHPYLLYDQLPFTVPTYSDGDVLARVRVRIDEAFQSFAMLRQLIEEIPSGPIVTAIGTIPAHEWGIGWTESPRGENVHWLMTGPDGTVYRYRVRSAAYSNWPAVPHTVPGNIVPDFPLINKSFELCYACCDR